ncbi:MAG: ATP-dependent Clp protease adaptor ClpS [Gemmataceae bacterium]|nr:ATP-dependent Clp protease adaptor ClpS [Gemmataceae bacterium]
MSGPAVLPDVEVEEQQETRRQPPYHVILLDDDDHSFEYVIVMLKELFAHPVEKGYELAKQVDEKGRAVVCTTSRERAELKQEQIHAYGPDPLIPRCQGSMTAVIEPAE